MTEKVVTSCNMRKLATSVWPNYAVSKKIVLVVANLIRYMFVLKRLDLDLLNEYDFHMNRCVVLSKPDTVADCIVFSMLADRDRRYYGDYHNYR